MLSLDVVLARVHPWCERQAASRTSWQRFVTYLCTVCTTALVFILVPDLNILLYTICPGTAMPERLH
jgi:hypothetical protein